MPGMRRRGRPGLIGTAARTAVIAGTATAAAGAVNRRQAERDEQQAYEEQQVAYQDAAHQAAAQQAAAPQDDLTTQLLQLAQLHSQGALTDAEFAGAKAKLLA
jgi:hypothetical protein